MTDHLLSRGERQTSRGGAWFRWGAVLLCVMGCGEMFGACSPSIVPCDYTCQDDFFICFREGKSCGPLCEENGTMSCQQKDTKDQLIKEVSFTQTDCGKCQTAWELWQLTPECEAGRLRCQRVVDASKKSTLLLQQCVTINKRLTWSDGRPCQKGDPFPCREVGGLFLCTGCNNNNDCGAGTCDLKTNSCTQCVQDGDCKAPGFGRCIDGRCLSCKDDSDCRFELTGLRCVASLCVCESDDSCQQVGFTSCQQGACVKCSDEVSCPTERFGAGARCQFGGRCLKQCTQDGECSSYKSGYCHPAGLCAVGCVDDEDCKVPKNTPFCVESRCRQCTKDVDCVGSTLGPRCDTTRGTCRQCLTNDDCPETKRCTATKNCVDR